MAKKGSKGAVKKLTRQKPQPKGKPIIKPGKS